MTQACSHSSSTESPWLIVQRLGLSGIAAGLSESITYPLDFVKTRQQLMSASSARGVVFILHKSVRQEGLLSVYSGISLGIARHLIYTPIRVITFEYLREKLSKANCFRLVAFDVSEDACVNGRPSLSSLLVSGFVAGGIAQAVATPIDLIKIRLQSYKSDTTNRERQRMKDVISTVLKREGLKGLWRGAGPSIARASLVNLGELSTYSIAKRAIIDTQLPFLRDDGALTHVSSAMCSGFVAALISTPADVLKSRVMAGDNGSKYSNTMHNDKSALHNKKIPSAWSILMQTARTEGLKGLYGGFMPGWLRLAPWQLVYWLSYEKLRNMCGLPSF